MSDRIKTQNNAVLLCESSVSVVMWIHCKPICWKHHSRPIIIIIIISNELDYGGIVTLLLQDDLTMLVSRNSAKAVNRQGMTA